MKAFLREPFVWLAALFVMMWIVVFWLTQAMGLLSFQFATEGLSGDPFQYDALARSLATSGTFALDGRTPFFEREPGYSIFLAGVYVFFGIGNHAAVFLIQAALHILATYCLMLAVRRFVPLSATIVFSALLLFSPSIFHALFALTRESVALSLTMFFTAATLRFVRLPSLGWAFLCGIFFGALILVDIPFLLFPVVFVALMCIWRVPWAHVALSVVACIAVIAPWGVRNIMQRDMLCLTGCYRSALQWYVRGEQAEHIGIGSEPALCLWAEYVSRDWSERSPYCSFNAVWHAKWPEGFVGVPDDAQIARDGQRKILAHFPRYIWFSLFEVVELHLPYVNGWGRIYNVLAVAWTAIVYGGCFLSVPFLRKKEYLFFIAYVVYITGVFALTDATPRYLVPILHSYAFCAAIGYTSILRLWRTSPLLSRL